VEFSGEVYLKITYPPVRAGSNFLHEVKGNIMAIVQ